MVAVDGDETRSSPTVSRRWLISELRRLRQESGLSQGEVAKELGTQMSKLSMMESGHRLVQVGFLQSLLTLYGVPDDAWEGYITAARDSRRRGWWETHANQKLDWWVKRFIGLEQGASGIRSYQPGVIQGLLQTADYTAALLRQSPNPLGPEKIGHRVEQRARRQEVLVGPSPLEVGTVIDEAALRRVVGGPDVMKAQLTHLVMLADLPNVTVQVLPFDRAGAFAAHLGTFTIFSFPHKGDPGVVYLEHRTGASFLDSLDDINEYSVDFEELRRVALTPEESAQFILADRKRLNLAALLPGVARAVDRYPVR